MHPPHSLTAHPGMKLTDDPELNVINGHSPTSLTLDMRGVYIVTQSPLQSTAGWLALLISQFRWPGSNITNHHWDWSLIVYWPHRLTINESENHSAQLSYLSQPTTIFEYSCLGAGYYLLHNIILTTLTTHSAQCMWNVTQYKFSPLTAALTNLHISTFPYNSTINSLLLIYTPPTTYLCICINTYSHYTTDTDNVPNIST